MTRWDTAVSAGAWEDLVAEYRRLYDECNGDPGDFEVAELLRQKLAETEGL